MLSINENEIPVEALALKRYFNADTEWDRPEINIVGPQEMDIEFDELLNERKPKTKLKFIGQLKNCQIILYLWLTLDMIQYGIIMVILLLQLDME